MSLTPLDESTYKLAAATLMRARVTGTSPLTALHTAGLLLGPDLASRLREEAILSAAENIRQSRLRDLIGDGNRYLRDGATPTEVRAAIVGRLEALAEAARAGRFR